MQESSFSPVAKQKSKARQISGGSIMKSSGMNTFDGGVPIVKMRDSSAKVKTFIVGSHKRESSSPKQKLRSGERSKDSKKAIVNSVSKPCVAKAMIKCGSLSLMNKRRSDLEVLVNATHFLKTQFPQTTYKNKVGSRNLGLDTKSS